MVSDLSSWTLLISQQQEETARAQKEENDQLEREIAFARQARASRQSGFLSRPSTFASPSTSSSARREVATSPSSSSLPSGGVNKLASSSSDPRPTSLAGMLGSTESGPRLTKTPQHINTGPQAVPSPSSRGVGPSDTNERPALAATATPSGGHEQGGVARRWTPATLATPSTLAKPSMKPVEHQQHKDEQNAYLSKPTSAGATLPCERRTSPSNAQSSTSSQSVATNQRSTTLPTPMPASGSQPHRSSSPLEHRSKPSLTSYGSYSSSTTAPAPSLLRPIPKPDPSPPGISPPSALPSEAFLRPSANKAPTASLTRLKGRGIVEEQLRKSRLRNDGDDDGALNEFGSPSMGSGEWGSSGSGGRSTRPSGGSGGFPRSVVPERSQTLPASSSAPSSAKEALPILRPTRQHRPSASISQLPTQPAPSLAPTASRHRPTSSVGRLPTIGALSAEPLSSIDRHLPPRVRWAGKVFQPKASTEALSPSAASSTTPLIPAIAGSPRVSVKSFVKSVESPVADDGGPGRRLFPARSRTAPMPPSEITIPTTTSSRGSAAVSPALPSAKSNTSSPLVSSPPLANPYSTFFTPSSATARPPSPVKPTFKVSIEPIAPAPVAGLVAEEFRPPQQEAAALPGRKHLRGVGLPGMASRDAPERKAPPSPIKTRSDDSWQAEGGLPRSASPTKAQFSGLPSSSPAKKMFSHRPTSTEEDSARSVVIPRALPGGAPPSPTKTGRASPFTFAPSSPTKAKVSLPDSPTKASAALALSSATPVRVRRGKSGSGADLGLASEEPEEKTIAPAAGSPTGGLAHPTRDRARKPKSKNRPSLVSPSASAASLVQPPTPVSPIKNVSAPLSSVKIAAITVAPPASPTKKVASPVTLTFQNLAQRKSVWGDQPPIGIRPLSSHSRGENIVEKEVTPAKGPKGTFGGKALPGMVAREDKVESAPVIVQAIPNKVSVPAVTEVSQPAKKIAMNEPVAKLVTAPLPAFSVESILSFRPSSTISTAPPLTLSLEILSILPSGQTSSLPASPPGVPWIFYESELLAIVHRSKSRETGLVGSMVWGWQGRGWADERGRGIAKLKDIGGRLSAGVVDVRQGDEGEELMQVLGGKLVVRQGPREHFSAENTSLYTVQESRGSLFVDEVDLLPTSLTSRHSLVLTVLSQVFLYHGRGSLRSERIVGRQYAALLAKDSPAPYIELEEEEEHGKRSEDSELFWMCFGEPEDEEGSRADHWKVRGKGGKDEMRVWKVDARGKEKITTALACPTAQTIFGPGTGIKLVLLSFELFVVVPTDARTQTRDIELALQIAEAMSHHLSPRKPFLPPVHALFLPSRIPVDLKTYFRCLDEDAINGGRAPEHMNVLSLEDTRARLSNGLSEEGWIKMH